MYYPPLGGGRGVTQASFNLLLWGLLLAHLTPAGVASVCLLLLHLDVLRIHLPLSLCFLPLSLPPVD